MKKNARKLCGGLLAAEHLPKLSEGGGGVNVFERDSLLSLFFRGCLEVSSSQTSGFLSVPGSRVFKQFEREQTEG